MSKNYVNNEDILKEISIYKDTGVMTEKLGIILIQIMKGLSSKGNFYGYTWKEDMVAEGLLTCVKYLKNFDPEKSQNPFSYITKIGYMSFIAYIKKQKKHSEIKKTCYEFHENNMETEHTSDTMDYQDIKHLSPKEFQ